MIWIVLWFLLVGASFFRTAEIAFLIMGKSSIRFTAQGENTTSQAEAFRSPEQVLTTILIGNTIMNVTFAALVTMMVLNHYGRSAVAIAVGLTTALILIFGEILPRAVANQMAHQITLKVAQPLLLLSTLLKPLIYVVALINRFTIRLWGGKEEPLVMVTEAEIRSLISLGHEQGVLEHEEEEMLTSVFEFRDTVASEVMTPRLDLPLVSVSATLDEAANCILKQGVSRLAAYESHSDHIVGVVHIEDVLRAKMEHQECLVQKLVRPALVVPESKLIGDLFEQMRKKRVSTAIVADEYGSSSGVITLEDLVEHIVGDLWDEHDPDGDEDNMVVSEGVRIVDGKLSIDEINDALNTQLPDEYAHTLGGWIFHTLGRLPQQGDVVTAAGVEFRVVSMDRWRVDKVRVTHLLEGDNPPTT